MSTAEETVLHIFKRHMGLTKRGSSDNEPLTVSNVSVNQTDNFTLRETSKFATLIIPTAQILQTKVSDETTGSAFCVMQLGQFKINILHSTVILSFPIRIHYSVKHLNQVCFTGLRRQQTTPAAVLQGGCCAHLQRDKSQNALDHGERTAMHR